MSIAVKTIAVLVAMLVVPPNATAQSDLPPQMGYLTLDWSPDGTRIAYTKDSDLPGKYEAEIYVMTVHDGHARQLTHGQPVEAYGRWSRDGRRIIYMSQQSGQQPGKILLISADRKATPVRVTDDATNAATPDISPNGRFVALAEMHDGRHALIVRPLPSGPGHLLFSRPEFDIYSPIWSPDGSQLAFYSDAGNHHDQVWVVDADGTNPRRLTDGTGHNIFPSWSPDGTRIVFSAQDAATSTYKLKIISPNGGATAEVPGSEGAFMASWSAKNRIAFIKQMESGGGPRGRQIVMVDPDGSRRVELQPK